MSEQYLDGMSFSQYRSILESLHPWMSSLFEPEETVLARRLENLCAVARNEFEDDVAGRGDSYRKSQESTLVRGEGIERLLGFARGERESFGILLDVLGGSGTVAEVVRQWHGGVSGRVVTADIAGRMVAAALAKGLPAIRQRAEESLLASESVDSVLIAYGFHHIARGDRRTAVLEAARVLVDGGRVVLHDFVDDGPIAAWFSDVVGKYSYAGHDYCHFTREEMWWLLREAELCDIEVVDILDPFVLSGDSEDSAWNRLVSYVTNMYGLQGEICEPTRMRAVLEEYFSFEDHALFENESHRATPNVREIGPGRFVAELPRVAIVAHATKR